MRAFSLAFLSLLAASQAAVVLPRQQSTSTSAVPSLTASPSSGSSASGSVPTLSALSTTTTTSTTTSTTSTANPTTTAPYVAPSSTAIGADAVGQANANETDASTNAQCERITLSVPIVNLTQPSYDTIKLGVEPAVNQSRITDLFIEFVTAQQNFTDAYANGTHIINDSFNISGVFCEPQGANATTLELLVHGIGFDSSYWNIRSSEYNLTEQDYSYVYRAHDAGRATFRYDRLGTGQSERPADGYNLVQANLEVAILENIAQRIRNSSDVGGRPWNSTVLVGHSYGSAQSQRLAQLRPELIDALVLTGFSTNQTGFPFTLTAGVYTQAETVFPERFANISKHWLVTGTPFANQIPFTHAPAVTTNATDFVRGTEQPVTQGAFFSIGNIIAPASNYTGPVQVVLGEKDFIFAFNNPYVNGPTDLATAAIQQLFPAAANTSVGSIIPLAGHGINYHITAPIAYNATTAFLEAALGGGTPTDGGNNATTTATPSSAGTTLPSASGATAA